MIHYPVTGQRGGVHLPGGGREAAPGRCLPSCCKTPLGHSVVRDHLPANHKDACHCHPDPEGQKK